MKETTRETMRAVLKRASAARAGAFVDTEVLYGMGFRESPALSYERFNLERISQWTPDVDPRYINWGLSASTRFRQKLVVEHHHELHIDWWLLVDCARTMDFGTQGDFKRSLAAVLDATLIQTADTLKDKVAHLVYDEERLRGVYEPSPADDLLPAAMQAVIETQPAARRGAVARGANRLKGAFRKMLARKQSRAETGVEADKSGLAFALRQLPEEPSIVPVISDFMHMTEEDKRRLAKAAGLHKVLCLVVEDIREREFPKGLGMPTLRDMTTGRLETMTFAQADKLVSEDRAKRLAELTAFFKQARCPFQIFSTEESPSEIRRKVVRLLHS